MNSYDITYCTNEECSRVDCRRHVSKIPATFVWVEKFKEKNCKHFLQGTSVNLTAPTK